MKANTIYTIIGVIVLVAIIYAVYRTFRTKNIRSRYSLGATEKKEGRLTKMDSGLVVAVDVRRTSCKSTDNMICDPISVSTPNGIVEGCRCKIVGVKGGSPQYTRVFISGSNGMNVEVNEAGIPLSELSKTSQQEYCERHGGTWNPQSLSCSYYTEPSTERYIPRMTTIVTPRNTAPINPASGANGI